MADCRSRLGGGGRKYGRGKILKNSPTNYNMSIASQKKYFTDKIHDVGVCESLQKTHVQLFTELVHLFQNHPDAPEKIKGLYDISIRKTQFGKLGLFIHTDRGEEPISYCCCISKKPRQTNLYREAIYPQILDFKKKVIMWKCENCQQDDSFFHIDHIYPFKNLLNDFLKENDSIESWLVYHKDNARLQVLCEKCNLQKGSKLESIKKSLV